MLGLSSLHLFNSFVANAKLSHFNGIAVCICNSFVTDDDLIRISYILRIKSIRGSFSLIEMTTFETIAVADIAVLNNRIRLVTGAAVSELAESIKAGGLLNPIIVRQISDHQYRLVAGEHRLQAFKLLERERIPAMVRPEDDSPAADFEDQLSEIDENAYRSFTEGELKLAIWERRRLLDEMARHSGLGKRDAAREANLQLATFANAKQRTVLQRVKEGGFIKRIADWAKVDARELARSSISTRSALGAAIEIIDSYGKGVVVEGGNVHQLLKKHIRAAAKGEEVDLVGFKKSVDGELRREELGAKRDQDASARDRHVASLASKTAKQLGELVSALESYAKLVGSDAGRIKAERQAAHWRSRVEELERLRVHRWSDSVIETPSKRKVYPNDQVRRRNPFR